MRRKVGRPTVAQTVARTAVVAGTATVVSGAVAGSQQQKAAAAQQQAAAQQAQIEAAAQQAVAEQAAAQQAAAEQVAAEQAPAAAPGITDDTVAQLQKLSELRNTGVLSEEEFAALKAKLLNL